MKSIITGITGQDGSYLAKELVNKGHEVTGLVRSPNSSLFGLEYLELKNIDIQIIDLANKDEVNDLIKNLEPDYFYNLAAQSSVGDSFMNPHESILFNLHSTLNALESIRLYSPETIFYQATSSEMFGDVASLPISENTLLHPQSPYAISKAACHHLVKNYRESYDLNACSGILFNHESVLRRPNFFIMKVVRSALDIKNGNLDELRVGNIDIKRDFGYAPKYVEAMVLMAEDSVKEDYIICSGKSISLRSVIEHVFNCLGISLDKIVVDKKFFRPSEISDIYGDNSKAINKLNWSYDLSFYSVIELILEEYSRYIYEV